MAELNKNQKTAIRHKDGPMLVFSGPGSGKTTVITRRLIFLVRNYGIDPKRILTITFTKAAATEMESRYMASGGEKGVAFSTFHALFFRIIRERFGYSLNMVLSENDKREFLTRTVESYDIETDDVNQTVDTFLMNYGLVKNNLTKTADYTPRDMGKEEFGALYRLYEGYKERNEKIDFDDMMLECYILLKNDSGVLNKWRKKYDYILIDEFQDINRAQYECIKMIACPLNNIFAVGDDDQSIYGFRGASPEFVRKFTEDYSNCRKILLDVNYRSTDQIISISGKIIAKNRQRFPKNIVGTGKNGCRPVLFFCENPSDEADRIVREIIRLHNEQHVPYGEMAVIYRNNLAANAFARRFVKNNIPYYLKDNTYNVYDHWIAKDFCAYADFIWDTDNDEAFARIVNKPSRHVSRLALEDAERMGMSLFYGVMNSDRLSRGTLEELQGFYDDIQRARKFKGREQAEYIYRMIGYEKYLESYAAYKKCSSVFLKEICYEVLDMAGETDDLRKLRGILSEYKNLTSKAALAPGMDSDAVTLTTMHSSKGLEFNTVFIPSIVDGVIPHGNQRAEFDTEEERRLFYVAATRAKERLYFSTFSSIGSRKVKMSGFLREIGVKDPTEKQKNI